MGLRFFGGFAVAALVAVVLLFSGCIEQPVCGNGICEVGEDSISCSQDCSELETCSAQGGDTCEENELCEGAWLEAPDSARCCSIECSVPGETCSELNGNVCEKGQICAGEWIDAEDTGQCCSGECNYCGNEECETTLGETEENCPEDCMSYLDNRIISTDTTLESRVYYAADAENDGAIIIGAGNVTLDCAGAEIIAQGAVDDAYHSVNFNGYGIYNDGHSNVTIKNCKIHGFYYAIYSKGGDNIVIRDNNLSDNFVVLDRAAWSEKTVGPLTEPHILDYSVNRGGGIYLEDSSDSEIRGNTAKNQNIGIDFYSVQDTRVANNDVSHNMTWGIHLRSSNNNTIEHNEAHHIAKGGLGKLNPEGNNRCNFDLDSEGNYFYANEDYPCGADTGGMMIIDSHHNTITNNNFQWNDVGLFLSANEFHVPTLNSNDNYIAHNDGSHALSNSFEVTFGERNVLFDNIGNYSNFGIWAGVSKDYEIRSNTLQYNKESGIEIEIGTGAKITGNLITNNSNGIKLRWAWSQGLIDAYPDRLAEDYELTRNTISENTHGLVLDDLLGATINGNDITDNAIGILFKDNWESEIREGINTSLVELFENGNANLIVSNNSIYSQNPSHLSVKNDQPCSNVGHWQVVCDAVAEELRQICLKVKATCEALREEHRASPNSSYGVVLEGNYWGVTTSDEIKRVIFDREDDPYFGTIDFEPWLEQPVDTPNSAE